MVHDGIARVRCPTFVIGMVDCHNTSSEDLTRPVFVAVGGGKSLVVTWRSDCMGNTSS